MAMTLGKITPQYVSTLQFDANTFSDSIHIREVLRSVLDVTGEEEVFYDLMQYLGRFVETPNVAYNHATNVELYRIYTINGVPTDNSGGSGQGDVTVVVTDVSGASAIRVGDLVMAASGYAGYVSVVTADAGGDQIRIKAVNSSVTTANLAFANTQKFTVFGRAEGRGSKSPAAIRYPLDLWYNQVQIIKERMDVDDVEQASTIEFDYNGGSYYFIKAQHEALVRAKGAVAFTMIMGQMSDPNFKATSPTLVDGDGLPAQTTRGLDEYITTMGISQTPGAVNLAFYDALTADLAAARAPKQYFVFVGQKQSVAHDNMLNALTAATEISPNARFSVDGKTLDIGVDAFKLYNYQFIKVGLPILDHQTVVNFTGSAGYEKNAYFVPTGKIKTHGGGGMVDRIRLRYMRGPFADFMWREIMTGAMAPTPTDDESILAIHYETIMGLECLGVQHFVKASLT